MLPVIVVLVGLPGSGKSTWLRQRGQRSISSDDIRGMLADDETIQTIHADVFAVMRDLVRRRIRLQRPLTYVDATHLNPRERRPYIKMAELYECTTEALFFDVPLAVCKQRNLARPRVVPEEAMDVMAARLVPPSEAEGFARVTIIGERTSTTPPAQESTGPSR